MHSTKNSRVTAFFLRVIQIVGIDNATDKTHKVANIRNRRGNQYNLRDLRMVPALASLRVVSPLHPTSPTIDNIQPTRAALGGLYKCPTDCRDVCLVNDTLFTLWCFCNKHHQCHDQKKEIPTSGCTLVLTAQAR